MKRAAAYARVSTEHQSKDTSIDAQFEIIRQYAKQQNIQIVAEYYDKESGGKSDRPQFESMIQAALRGEFDLIIVDKYDRFFREGVEDQRITKILEQHGVHVIAALEPVDPRTPAGWFARWIFSGMYEMQRRYIAEETARKMMFAARKGYWMGGKPPFGFRTVEVKDSEGKVRKKLVPYEPEAEIVRKAFEMYAKSHSLNDIIRFLNENATPRKGKKWSKASVYDMLHNPKYAGIYIYAKGTKTSHRIQRDDMVIIEGAIEPIIPRELFEAVQKRTRAPAPQRNLYILRGLIFCGVCGAPMVGNCGHGTGWYVCSAYKNKQEHEHVGIAKKKAESFVHAYVQKVLSQDIDFVALANELNRLEELNALAQDSKLSEIQQRINEIDQEIANIVNTIKKGVSSLTLEEELIKLEQEKQHLKSQLFVQPKRFYTAEQLQAQWEELKRELLSQEGARRVYEALIEKVVVYPGGYIEITPR